MKNAVFSVGLAVGLACVTIAGTGLRAQDYETDRRADGLVQQAAAYHERPLDLTPCPENPSLECGTLMVPIDYNKPFGKTVGIGVMRARATNPATRIGVVVGNPGGPGLSGVDFVLAGITSPAFVRLRERFDIVSFDPRGVKRSRAVACAVDYPEAPADVDDDAALTAYFVEVSHRFAKACLDQNGDWVTAIGTNDVARDIDVLRRALGERQITYASGSYGSQLGAVYASLFPERVRAMLLDGGIAPEFHDYFVEFWSEYAGGFEKSFQYVDQLCRRDAGCRLADIGVVHAYDEVAARLRTAPVTAPNGAILTADALADIVGTLLGHEGNYRFIVSALADARATNYALLFQLLSIVPAGSAPTLPIWCNDYGTRKSAAEYLPIDEAVGALTPRFFGRFFVAQRVSRCAAWPKADPPIIRNVRHRMDAPILITGNHFDPNTPLADARRLAHALGMDRSLIRYAGGGHTAFGKTTACMQEAIETYLFDLVVPAEGTTCPARVISFSPPAQQRTTAAAGAEQVSSDPVQEFWGAPKPRIP